MLLSYHRGQGSIVLRVKILDSSVSTGAGKTGLTSSSSGLVIAAIADNEAATVAYTAAGSTIEAVTTLGTYAAPTATKCRFKEVDSTNHKGVYEIQLADARYAVSGAKSLLVSVSGVANAAETDVVIPLTDLDPYDATAGGISRLDAAVSSRMATYTQPTGFLAATFPLLVASTTNITTATVTLADGSLTTAKLGAFALAKTTNITGFNDLSAAQVNAEADTALVDAGVTTARATKLDNIPSATAGSNGGLLIAGSNAATTLASLTVTGAYRVQGGVVYTNAAGDGFQTTSTGGDGRGWYSQGNGTGAGIYSEGSYGLYLEGNTAGFYALDAAGTSSVQFASGTAGISVTTTGAAEGFHIEAAGAAGLVISGGTGSRGIDVSGPQGNVIAAGVTAGVSGLTITGRTSGAGLRLVGGTTGHGLALVGGSTSGDGLNATVTSGAPIRGNITGDLVGTVTVQPSWYAVPAIADAVWDENRSGHTTAGTFGYYLDAQVSLAGSGGLTVQGIVDGVWDGAMGAHVLAGSTGERLNAAGAAGDPLASAVPGNYATGTAGWRLGFISQLTTANLSQAADTVLSSLNAYATVADFLKRWDSNVVAQLVSDSGVRVDASALATSPILAAALKAASGRLEAAVLTGERYTVASLSALASSNSGEFLVDIICGLAMGWLYDRRPDPSRPVYPLVQQAESALEALSNGHRIFGLLATAQAGHAAHTADTVDDPEQRRELHATSPLDRLFGVRSSRLQ